MSVKYDLWFEARDVFRHKLSGPDFVLVLGQGTHQVSCLHVRQMDY